MAFATSWIFYISRSFLYVMRFFKCVGNKVHNSGIKFVGKCLFSVLIISAISDMMVVSNLIACVVFFTEIVLFIHHLLHSPLLCGKYCIS